MLGEICAATLVHAFQQRAANTGVVSRLATTPTRKKPDFFKEFPLERAELDSSLYDGLEGSCCNQAFRLIMAVLSDNSYLPAQRIENPLRLIKCVHIQRLSSMCARTMPETLHGLNADISSGVLEWPRSTIGNPPRNAGRK
jgi:hypothetical protein